MTSYLKKYSQRDFKDQEKIFNLFRILSFLKNKKSFVETSDYKILAGQVYYSFTFPLIEFIRYIGMNPKSHSQRTKVLNILTTLQTLEPIIQNFDDHYFQSSLIVPAFNIKKTIIQSRHHNASILLNPLLANLINSISLRFSS
jgi:hypothetical protein